MLTDLEHRTSLVDALLAEQARPGTAVMRFSEWHDQEGQDAPLQARYYQKLIPMTKPAKGEQYAFEVNLEQCTGCKACVVACHSLNGLDEDESWRDVGTLAGTGLEPFVQTVTTACHHCADPACANGCPVLAYEKDAETGIVRHLDDQCIGCSYCQLKCPYDVPKWNAKRGIVRKCDMCHQRLAVGEAPACVQACPNEAIAIRMVKLETVREAAALPGARLLPHAFDSRYTQPTTRYLGASAMPQAVRDAGAEPLRLEAAHWPLVWMLLLTQMAAGLLTTSLAVGGSGVLRWAALATLMAGLGCSVLHLGQPLRAWRCFLGWRKSWLSREIMIFGAFKGAAVAACILPVVPVVMAAVVTGWLGVFCSAMVYVDTRRPFWSAGATFTRFAGTTLLLGSSGAAVLLAWSGDLTLAGRCALAAMLVRAVLFADDQWRMRRALRDSSHPCYRPARVMQELCAGRLRARRCLFVVSTALGALAILDVAGLAAGWAFLSWGSTMASQLVERHLFFVAVEAPRMVTGSASSHA